MLTQEKRKPTAKIWLEYDGDPLLGKGGAEILRGIEEAQSISKAAKRVGMSYRYVWNYLDKVEKALGEDIVTRFRGGKSGGGGATLTQLGKDLLRQYERVESYVGEVLGDKEYWEAVGLKLSARNRLKGTIRAVEKGDIVAKVKMEITSPATITAIISREAVEDLNLKAGDNVEAVIKATEIMVAKEK